MYGHVEKLAEEIKKGAASVEGVEAKLWQVGNDTSLSSYIPLFVFGALVLSFLQDWLQVTKVFK